MELWIPIDSHPRYAVSNEGRVKNLKTGRVLKPGRHTFGYHLYGLSTNAKSTTFTAHSLVCRAFHGPPPTPKSVVMHLNDDPGDNRADNVKWGSQKDNLSTARNIGRAGQVSAAVRQDILKATEVMSDAEVAGIYGIGVQSVRNIRTRAGKLRKCGRPRKVVV